MRRTFLSIKTSTIDPVALKDLRPRKRISQRFQLSFNTFNNPRHAVILSLLEVVDHATIKFQVKIKEALHISCDQPSLNKQLYVNLTLSF